MLAPVLVGLLGVFTAAQVVVDLEGAVRSDVRGGLSPNTTSVTGPASPTAELTLSPSLGATIEGFGWRTDASYAPTLQLRGQYAGTGAVLGQHAGGLSSTTGNENRFGALTLAGRFVAGRLDLGTASRLLGQPAGAATASTLSVADAMASATWLYRPIPRLLVSVRGGLNLLGIPSLETGAAPAGIDVLAFFLLPDVATLTPFMRAEVQTSAAFSATRQTTFSFTTRAEAIGQLAPTGYGGVLNFASARHLFSRNLVLSASAGALLGLEQQSGRPGATTTSVVSPYADTQIDLSFMLMRGAQLGTSLGLAVEPTYDLFLQRVTHRASFRASSNLTLRKLTLTATATSWSLLPELGLGVPRAESLILGDAHVFSGDVVARLLLLTGLEVGAGLTSFLRLAANPVGFLAPPGALLPEVMGFAFIRASTALRL